jgi:hypothetical protein
LTSNSFWNYRLNINWEFFLDHHLVDEVQFGIIFCMNSLKLILFLLFCTKIWLHKVKLCHISLIAKLGGISWTFCPCYLITIGSFLCIRTLFYFFWLNEHNCIKPLESNVPLESLVSVKIIYSFIHATHNFPIFFNSLSGHQLKYVFKSNKKSRDLNSHNACTSIHSRLCCWIKCL